jgi:hypothetical protein
MTDEHCVKATDPGEEPQAVVLPSPLKVEEEEPFSIEFEEEPSESEMAFGAPFQLSGATPMVSSPAQAFAQTPGIPPLSAPPSPRAGGKPRMSSMMAVLVVCVVVIVGLLVINVLAQTPPPLQTHANSSSTSNQQKLRGKASLTVTKAPGKQSAQASDWVPQQLPTGWTHAGLLTGDAIQALRTAVAFNDREMSLDSRSVGTRNKHGGTFTAATFAMTLAAKQRFLQNDVRESNNSLFDLVVNTRLVRLVVNPQPQLVTFVQQGGQQFAWVDVAFQLWQSQIDPNASQQRIEGKELIPMTNQVYVHHMMVLLLRVPAQNAGNTPAMGGTGWLVSNYGLDLPNAASLAIVQPA